MSELIRDLPEHEYHAHPALSSTGARRLLDTCPALFKWELDHPKPSTKALDLGSAAHSLVLGSGPQLWVVDAEDWRKKATQEAAEEARGAGMIPLLRKDFLTVTRMARALRAHPLASALLDPEDGQAEASMFWQRDGVECRARADFLRPDAIVDYKSTINAHPDACDKHVFNYGYHQQADWYTDGVEAVTGERLPFYFIFQEKAAPYLINVVDVSVEALRAAARLNLRARDTYRECAERDYWPGYGEQVQTVTLPAWARDWEDVA